MSDELSSSHSSSRAATLLDVREVAAMLGCSPRHVYRLAGAGRMPKQLRLGGLVRWNRIAVEKWISDGCPIIREHGVKRASQQVEIAKGGPNEQ